MIPRRFWYDHRIYPFWGPLALWWNVRLYGHFMPPRNEDNWTSRLWKRTPWGRRRWAAKCAQWATRRERGYQVFE